MFSPEVIERNIYTSSFFSVKQTLTIYFVIVMIVLAVWGISQTTPAITLELTIYQSVCQDQLLKYVNDEQQQDALEKLYAKNLVCIVCWDKPVNDDPLQLYNYLHYEQEQNSVNGTVQFSLFGKDLGDREPCLPKALDGVDFSNFPPKGGIHSENGEVTWVCDNKKDCKTKTPLFEALNPKSDYVLYQRINLKRRPQHFSNHVMQYNDQYYVYNEVIFMIWIGLEIIFMLLICGLKAEEKVNDKIPLIKTHGRYLYIILTIVLNNDVVFPLQVVHDGLTLRRINSYLQLCSQYLLFFYVSGTLRTIQNLGFARFLFILFEFILYTSWIVSQSFMRSLVFKAQDQEILQDIQPIVNQSVDFFNVYKLPLLTVIQILNKVLWGYLLLLALITIVKLPSVRGARSEVTVSIRGLKQFVYYSIFFLTIILGRLNFKFMNINLEQLYFDQVQTTAVNLFFYFGWWFFDLEEWQEVQERLYEIQQEMVSVSQAQSAYQQSDESSPTKQIRSQPIPQEDIEIKIDEERKEQIEVIETPEIEETSSRQEQSFQ